MYLLLIRHGQSEGNTRPDVDLPDSQLTETGHRQANLLADAMDGLSIDRIIVSPLHRAIQTARPLATRRQLRIEVWPDLRELRYTTDTRGATADEWGELHPDVEPFWTADPTLEAMLTPQGWRYPGAEDDDSAMARAGRVVERLRTLASTDETVVLVAHGGFNSFLIRALLGVASHQTYVAQGNTAVNSLMIAPDFTIVQGLNDLSHLPVELRT